MRGGDMKAILVSILLAAGTPSMAHALPQALQCVSTPKLAVDADGAPDSYRVDGKGLSYTCDGVFAIVNGVAQTHKNNPANWQALCAQHWNAAKASGDYSKVKVVGFLMIDGKPVVQGAGDPLPGEAYVTTTTLTLPNVPDTAQRRYVNAVEIPYVVLPSKYATANKLVPGDVVAVYRPANGKLAYAVYGDCCSLGEGSVRLHNDLGSNPITIKNGVRRAKVEIEDKIVFVALTGAHTTRTQDAAAWRKEIQLKGADALAKLGGLPAVKACAGG
jgi:hypothetical protein